MISSIEKRATSILRDAYGPKAEFRDDQLEAIISVIEKKKTLVVQKTGWGKSIVYFIATKILRQDGAGPTIIVSPLLALMKNQIDSARRFGVKVETINSSNTEEWEKIYSNLNNYDALIISPERLSDDKFMESLSKLRNIKLFVVDEAHSISDWGHDFRPDYQRIVKLIEYFPEDIAILGTTATANDRVIEDIKRQLGENLIVSRGELIRENLSIQINPCQTREERLAWLAKVLNTNEKLNEGQGIIYCLTRRDCDIVAEYLKKYNISAEPYHSGLGIDDNESDIAEKNIDRFEKGEIRILVATIKLGMGYDKADIRFIVHFQLPDNLISYYQQIGRAGRDGEQSYAILLYGNEDEEILEYFIQGTQAKPELLNDIMRLTNEGITFNKLLSEINIKRGKLREALEYLSAQGYIYKDGNTYRKNISTNFDAESEREKQELLNCIRLRELKHLKEYLTIDSCYMKFVSDELDSKGSIEKCGNCSNCLGYNFIEIEINPGILNDARAHLRNKHGKISPRKQWGSGGRIPEDLLMKEGWILSDYYYSEVGQKVKREKYEEEHFSEDLIDMSAMFISDRIEENGIDKIVAVPSLRRPYLVPDFAKKLADSLNIEFENAVIKTQEASEQKEMENSAYQEKNIRNSVEIKENSKVEGKTILLVDDMVDSRWSLTVIAAKLLEAGAKAVYPFALVKTGSGD